MPQGLELQYRLRSQVRPTSEGNALLFGFTLGPIQIFVIANLPENNDYGDIQQQPPLVYVKLSIAPAGEWSFFKNHTPNYGKRKPSEER